ncbi:MAG: hypothetical protein ACLPJY_10325 [Rhodomicrobium sp.]
MNAAASGPNGEGGTFKSNAALPEALNPRRVSAARLFIRALGISFFSVLSVLIALYAFTSLPQVQDVLLDARPYWAQEVLYWGNFYLIGIFVWALPLVFSARLLLLQNFRLIGIDTEERFKFYIFVFPRFFAIIAFIGVLLGMISASENVPAALSGNVDELILRRFLQLHLIVLCVATACIILLIMMGNVFISFYRRRVEEIERARPGALEKSVTQIEHLTRKPAQQGENGLNLPARKPEFLTEATWVAAQRARVFMLVYMCCLCAILTFLVAIHFLLYSDTLRGLFAMPDMSSYPRLQAAWHFTADALSLNRAPLLLVLFGALLPFLTILALLSNRHQFPFIVAFIFGGVILSLFIGEGHDVRTETLSKEQQAALKPIAFGDALMDWKAASGWNAKGCEQLAAGAAELAGCPRPIIVAAEGGGSRAAFLLVSVLGALEDDSLDKQKNPTARPFHQRLFAISSVSGGSVGAAFFVSALRAQPKQGLEKLKKGLYRQNLWFRNVVAANPIGTSASDAKITSNFLTDFVSYKDSLQAALSNDFLSPTMIAYLARDVTLVSMFPGFLDRAGVLEIAWEDAFDDVYGTSRETSPLSAPLQAMAPSPDRWTPLVFMNATSIGTGRRVIVTPVKIDEPIGAGKGMLFADTYDFHELMCGPYPDPITKAFPELSTLQEVASAIPSLFTPVTKCADKKPVSIDIRLSTAASLSARSPFVSPHADVRDRRSQLIDSVADGGYFDNSGIVTALDIAHGLKTLDARLLPFILQVSNAPGWFEKSKNCALDSHYPASPDIPAADNFRPLGSLSDPLTVNATRVSRGYQTILALPQQAAQMNGGVPSASQIHICPQPEDSFLHFVMTYTGYKEKPEEKMHEMMMSMEKQLSYKSISLSWWLSPSLQAYLDEQLYTKNNIAQRNCVISLLEDGQGNGASVCQKP